MSISIGVMAHNEEKNIARLLDCIFKQKLQSGQIGEILVISSGSTDDTNKIVKKYAQRKSILKPIFQKKRLGKAAAVNLFLKESKYPLLVLVSADLLLKSDTLEHLISPFKNAKVGIVGAHPMPVNDKNTLMGYAAHFMWELHHEISLKWPKMGEMIAFRKIFTRIPVLSAVDEANIEPLIRGQGYLAVYAKNAIVYNKGPETVTEFIARRRHVAAGHLSVKHEYSYEVSTLHYINIFVLLFKKMRFSLQFFLYTPIIIFLEAYSRILGYLDYRFNLKNHTIWQVTPSTKQLVSD